MPISSIGLPASSPVSPIVSNAAAKAKPGTDAPPSTIVTLSAQAQKLSQSQNQSQNQSQQTNNTQTQTSNETAAKPGLQSVPKETNEASGIKFIPGEAKSGRISTYA